MTLLLENGDYVLQDNGRLRELTGQEQLLQRVLIKLTARRGGFPLMPTLGSRLWQLCRSAPAERETLAKQYVLEALSDETELTVTDVICTSGAGQAMDITVLLTRAEGTLSVTVSVT